MTDYEGGGYEGDGNLADFENNSYGAGGGSSPQPRASGHSHGGADDHSDSKSQVYAYSTLLYLVK